MTGLNTCTLLRAIMARRSRRINSSLLPENMGPQITSIHPILPLTNSMSLLLHATAALAMARRERGCTMQSYEKDSLRPIAGRDCRPRSEEHTSELQSLRHLV